MYTCHCVSVHCVYVHIHHCILVLHVAVVSEYPRSYGVCGAECVGDDVLVCSRSAPIVYFHNFIPWKF